MRNVTLGVCGEMGGLLCDASFADILIWSICCVGLAIKWQLEFLRLDSRCECSLSEQSTVEQVICVAIKARTEFSIVIIYLSLSSE